MARSCGSWPTGETFAPRSAGAARKRAHHFAVCATSRQRAMVILDVALWAVDRMPLRVRVRAGLSLCAAPDVFSSICICPAHAGLAC